MTSSDRVVRGSKWGINYNDNDNVTTADDEKTDPIHGKNDHFCFIDFSESCQFVFAFFVQRNFHLPTRISNDIQIELGAHFLRAISSVTPQKNEKKAMN